MSDGYRSQEINSTTPLIDKEYGTELTPILRNDDHHSIAPNDISSDENSNFIRSRFEKIVKKFDYLHVETRGIERVLPEDRTDLKIIDTALLWVGVNLSASTFAVGTLGPALFNLDLYESFVTIIIFNILGIIPVAGIACFGPASGLRTMVFSRYSWGSYGTSIQSVLIIIPTLGGLVIISALGAQILRVVFDDKLPITIGLIIIAIFVMIISFVGYEWIHTYERYSWIPVFIGYCIVAGISVKYFTYSRTESGKTTIPHQTSHWDISGMLNFGTSCFSASVALSQVAANYNTYFPEDTNQLTIYLLTFFGNAVGLITLELLGAAVYTGTYQNQNWADAYERDNVGGLLGAILSPIGVFGKLCLIFFALSAVASLVPVMYSLSLSMQVIAPVFERIPRVLYTVIGTGIYLLLAIFTAGRFNDLLASVLAVSSYSTTIFIVIVFEDHLIFRRCSYKNYDFSIWDNRKVLPISLPAMLAGLVGVVGVVLGMSQTWFHGPISTAISKSNLDLGFELGFIFSGVTYPLFRCLELYFVKQ